MQYIKRDDMLKSSERKEAAAREHEERGRQAGEAEA